MGLKILVVGSGGREHALAWKIAQSPLVDTLLCAPGNAGMAELAQCLPIPADDVAGLTACAVERGIDLVVIGPEAPLVLGLADQLRERGIKVFGPSGAAAELEGSKAFMKAILDRYAIPTAAHRTFTAPEPALEYIRAQGAPIVVKASGLAAGKGAIVCPTLAEAEAAIRRVMVEREFGAAGDQVVVEEFLQGEEASFIALVDGEHILPLAGSQDHKAVGDGDTGPNTGGMGAYSPTPVLTPELYRTAMEQVMEPTVRGMAAEGRPFQGVLYAGLMIHEGRIRVLEFNTRFGDPETQPILMRMRSDLVPLMLACEEGTLDRCTIDWDPRVALCVVMAAGGYPGSYAKGAPITGLAEAGTLPDVQVFHAGTTLSGDRPVTSGGRVLGVTALGASTAEAQTRAYGAVARIAWKDAYWRKDIGYRAVARERHPTAP